MKADKANALAIGLFTIAFEILQNKRADYSGDTDALKNLRSSEAVGVHPVRGVLTRMLDKMSRVSNLVDAEAKVADKLAENEFPDIVNYTTIIAALISEEDKAVEQTLLSARARFPEVFAEWIIPSAEQQMLSGWLDQVESKLPDGWIGNIEDHE